MGLDLKICVLESFHSYIQELPENTRYGLYRLLKNIGDAYEIPEIEEFAEDKIREIDRKPLDAEYERIKQMELQKLTLLQRLFSFKIN